MPDYNGFEWFLLMLLFCFGVAVGMGVLFTLLAKNQHAKKPRKPMSLEELDHEDSLEEAETEGDRGE